MSQSTSSPRFSRDLAPAKVATDVYYQNWARAVETHLAEFSLHLSDVKDLAQVHALYLQGTGASDAAQQLMRQLR